MLQPKDKDARVTLSSLGITKAQLQVIQECCELLPEFISRLNELLEEGLLDEKKE